MSLVLVVLLIIVHSGCGSTFFVGGVFDPGGSIITGSVSIVQLTTVVGPDGSTVQVTFVTFLQSGMASTMGFCGDQRSQFPLDQTVRANFNPGQPCATLIVIVII